MSKSVKATGFYGPHSVGEKVVVGLFTVMRYGSKSEQHRVYPANESWTKNIGTDPDQGNPDGSITTESYVGTGRIEKVVDEDEYLVSLDPE